MSVNTLQPDCPLGVVILTTPSYSSFQSTLNSPTVSYFHQFCVINLSVMLNEDKSSRPRTKFWPRGQLVLEDLTSLQPISLPLKCRGSNRYRLFAYYAALPRSRIKRCTPSVRLSVRPCLRLSIETFNLAET